MHDAQPVAIEDRSTDGPEKLTAAEAASTDGILVTERGLDVVAWNEGFLALWDLDANFLQSAGTDEILAAMARSTADARSFVATISPRWWFPTACVVHDAIRLHDGIQVVYRCAGYLGEPDGRWGHVWSFRRLSSKPTAEHSARIDWQRPGETALAMVGA